jgi:hypothetical protein
MIAKKQQQLINQINKNQYKQKQEHELFSNFYELFKNKIIEKKVSIMLPKEGMTNFCIIKKVKLNLNNEDLVDKVNSIAPQCINLSMIPGQQNHFFGFIKGSYCSYQLLFMNDKNDIKTFCLIFDCKDFFNHNLNIDLIIKKIQEESEFFINLVLTIK